MRRLTLLPQFGNLSFHLLKSDVAPPGSPRWPIITFKIVTIDIAGGKRSLKINISA